MAETPEQAKRIINEELAWAMKASRVLVDETQQGRVAWGAKVILKEAQPRIAALKADNMEFQEVNEYLCDKVKKLVDVIAALKKEVEVLKNEIEELKENADDHEDEYAAMGKGIKRRDDLIAKMKPVIDALKVEIEKKEIEAEFLRSNNRALQAQVEAMRPIVEHLAKHECTGKRNWGDWDCRECPSCQARAALPREPRDGQEKIKEGTDDDS